MAEFRIGKSSEHHEMKMRFGIPVFFLCWISVLQADPSIDLAKCERDVGNCEKFSFRRTAQNNSKVNNNSIEAKHVKSETMEDLEIIENRLVFEQSDIQENGNFGTVSHLDYMFHQDASNKKENCAD